MQVDQSLDWSYIMHDIIILLGNNTDPDHVEWMSVLIWISVLSISQKIDFCLQGIKYKVMYQRNAKATP